MVEYSIDNYQGLHEAKISKIPSFLFSFPFPSLSGYFKEAQLASSTFFSLYRQKEAKLNVHDKQG
jgi:hypothetical protein